MSGPRPLDPAVVLDEAGMTYTVRSSDTGARRAGIGGMLRGVRGVRTDRPHRRGAGARMATRCGALGRADGGVL